MGSPITVNKVHVFTGHKESLYALTPYSDRSFVSAGSDGLVVLWDLTNLESGNLIARVPASVYAMHYDPSLGHLILGQNFDGIHGIDMDSRKEIHSLKLTNKEIFDIQSDDRFFYVATGEGEVIWVDKFKWTIENRTRYADKSARCIDQDMSYLAVGFSDGHLRLIEKDSGKIIVDREAHQNSVFTVRFAPDGKQILTGSRDAHLKSWDSKSLLMSEDVVAHMYAINHIDFSEDGRHFVSCSMDKSIKIWDSSSFKLRKVIDKARHAGHGTSVNKLLWMPYQQYLVSCSDDRTISIWDINFDN